MKVLQINAVYELYSTGRNVKETHEYLLNCGVESFIASPELNGLVENCYQIGSKMDHKIHALLSRISGLQGYFSHLATKKLVAYIEQIKPDVIILHNLHSNYINFHILMSKIEKQNIGVIFVLHDCWFFTGKCVHYSEDNCYRWRDKCGNCPALKKGNKSWILDRSKKMLFDKKNEYNKLSRYAVVGVSEWVTEDAKKSILSGAELFKCIYNWIDLTIFLPNAEKKDIKYRYGLNNKFLILAVAVDWGPLKGSHILYELADKIPNDAKIIMIGGNSHIQKNEKILYIEKIQVLSELASWYAVADVFVNPSRQETFGKTTAEALACGTPVIGYAGTATKELVDDSCGVLVNSLVGEDYFHAVMKIKRNGKSYYSKKCRNRAETLFDRQKNLKCYYELIQRIVEN